MGMNYHRIAAPKPDGQGRCCLLLPGAYQSAEQFVNEGFVDIYHACDPGCELILVEAYAQYYLDQTLVAHLHGLIQTLRLEGPQHTPPMLLGISMGGYGALRYLMEHQNYFAAVLLLAPFLGERKTWLSIQSQGGLLNWRAPQLGSVDDSDLWAWLQKPEHWRTLVLGYGQQDRFNASHRLLAQALPEQQVVCVEGAHDWACWNATLPGVLQAARRLA